ncbi:unnamed protein product [Coregonus sp. 'balchen']|nr:unnamed protein product [Coregonus sp. 'balchen']
MEECTTYLQEKSNAVGCRLSYDKSDRFRTLTTKLVHQNKSYVQNHNLKSMVKLYPPTNLSVEMNKDPELNLYWNNSKNNHCIESEVRYRINNYKWQTSTLIREQNYAVPFPLKSSRYEFQVRARVNSILWRVRVLEHIWQLNVYVEASAVISGCHDTLHVGLACWSTGKERLRFILIPIVPNPGKNLDDKVEAWLHGSKDICFQPNFTERVCPVREYRLVPQTGSVSESESNLSIPTDQSDSLSTCSSSTSTLPVTSENERAGFE